MESADFSALRSLLFPDRLDASSAEDNLSSPSKFEGPFEVVRENDCSPFDSALLSLPLFDSLPDFNAART